MTHFKGGAKAKLGDYWLSTERNIEDSLAFTRPKTGTTGEGGDIVVTVADVVAAALGVVVVDDDVDAMYPLPDVLVLELLDSCSPVWGAG